MIVVSRTVASQYWPGAAALGQTLTASARVFTVVGVVVQGKATRRQVDLGVRTPGFVEARSGVEPADQVVVGGQERLGEGAPVTPTVVERLPPRGQEG